MHLKYFETLPEDCPPRAATDQEHKEAWRFVKAQSLDEIEMNCFLSQNAKGEIRPGVDPCGLASCSLFESTKCEGFLSARKFPKLRGLSSVRLSIPKGAGVSKKDSRGHIHFWMFADFDPISRIEELVPCAK